MKAPSPSRSELFDNIKCLLIFLVVFGHMLEPQTGGGVNFIYLNIYSFHMPAFIFVSGWFSRGSTLKKTVTKVLLPYLVFQLIYLLYAGLPVQFYSPYWILWYLFALFVWRLFLPLLRGRKGLAVCLWPVAVVVSLLCGYTDKVGYDFALSRVLVFLPYFLLGYCLAEYQQDLLKRVRTRLSRVLSLVGVLACAGFFYHVRFVFQRQWTFGAFTYEFTGSSPKIRLLLLGVALIWIWFLLSWAPERPLFALSAVGRNTLFVYLLHGFVKLQVDAHAAAIYRFGSLGNLALALGLAVALVALFGNAWLAGAWRKGKGWLRAQVLKE